MKDSSRSLRRHHRQRIRKNRSEHLEKDVVYKHSYHKMASMQVNTACVCSCFMCGNPRKFFNEKTIQERSLEELEKKELA